MHVPHYMLYENTVYFFGVTMLYLFNIFGLQEEIILTVPRGQSPGRAVLNYLFRTGWSNNVLCNMYYGRGFTYFTKSEVSEERWNAAREIKEKKSDKDYEKFVMSFWNK